MNDVLNIVQAANLLKISKDALYKYATAGFVPGFKMGNRWKFSRKVLEEWFQKQAGGKL